MHFYFKLLNHTPDNIFDVLLYILNNKYFNKTIEFIIHIPNLQYETIFYTFHITDSLHFIITSPQNPLFNNPLPLEDFLISPTSYPFIPLSNISNQQQYIYFIKLLIKNLNNTNNNNPKYSLNDLLENNSNHESTHDCQSETKPNTNNTNNSNVNDTSDELFSIKTSNSLFDNYRKKFYIPNINKDKELTVYTSYMSSTYNLIFNDIKNNKFDLKKVINENSDFKIRWLILTYLNLYNKNTFDNYYFLLEQEIIDSNNDELNDDLLEFLYHYECDKNKLLFMFDNNNNSWLSKDTFDSYIFE